LAATLTKAVGNLRTIEWTCIATLFSAPIAFAKTVDLPTRAYVYFERERAGAVVLEPASDILVLAERINACDANKYWPGEASTTGIDAYLVRTDKDGAFHLPPRRYDHVCSRVVLLGTAAVPEYRSLVGRVYFASRVDLSNPAYARVDRNNDVFLTKPQPGAYRLREIRNDWPFGSGVTIAMIRAIYKELRPELEPLLAQYSGGAYAFDARELREGLQQSLLLSDWRTMTPNERLQLIESLLGDYRDYNLKTKPNQSALYYTAELQRTVERYGANSLPKISMDSTIFELLHAMAALDGDWHRNGHGPPMSRLEEVRKEMGSKFEESRIVFPEKYERLEQTGNSSPVTSQATQVDRASLAFNPTSPAWRHWVSAR
jgi:hypothetical protein